MGLSIYDSEGGSVADISYHGFMNFRSELAKTLDFNLRKCEGYDGNESLPDHPLSILFAHSDCDGGMSWQDCLKLWPYLLAASKIIDSEWQDFCKELSDSFERCAKQKLDLEFR